MFKLHFPWRFLVVSFAVQWPASAETISLDSIPSLIRRHHPALSVATAQLEEVRGRALGAGRLPNPEFSVEVSPNIAGREFSTGISWEQRFPITARLQHEKAVSQSEILAAEAEVREVEWQLIGKAKGTAIKWLALNSQQELRKAHAANAADMKVQTEKRQTRGEASALDVGQFAVEEAQARVEIESAAAELEGLAAELTGQLGLASLGTLSLSGNLGDPVLPKVSFGDQRDSLQSLKHKETQAQQRLALEEAKRREDIAIGGTAEFSQNDDAGVGLEREVIAGIRVSIPIPLWNKNEGGIAEAQAQAQRVQREITALRAGIKAEAAAAYARMQILQRSLEMISADALKLAEDHVKHTQEAYAAGQTSLTDVLRARDQLFDLKSQRLDTLRDWHLARLAYETAIGPKSTSASPAK